MRILCDHNVPFLLIRSLPGYDLTHASQLGWHELVNGKLLAAAEEARFDVLLTADQNMRSQQNLTGRELAMIVLDTNHWPTVEPNLNAIKDALSQVKTSGFVAVAFQRR